MLALCREHRLEHRTKHIALRYFLARELQQRGQLRLAYVASEANTADIFTKALAPGDHQRFCTMLACFALLDWSCFPTCTQLILLVHPFLFLHSKWVELPRLQTPESSTVHVNAITMKRVVVARADVYAVDIAVVKEAEQPSDFQKLLAAVPPELQELLKWYPGIFPDDLPEGLPPERAHDHRIELEPGAQPTVQR
ncbi:unnamed protein product [Closterium sp. NIES-53]